MWSSNQFTMEFSFSGNGFLGVSGLWAKTKQKCTVINIYSSCAHSIRKSMWRDLAISKTGFGGDLWCMVGDFNAVKCRSERRGVNLLSSDPNHAVEFQEFIDDMNLIDLPVLGN